MLVSELQTLIAARPLNEASDRQVECCYTCDLLSWVMAKGKRGCAWITVQTHMNVVAVASLHDMACIICPEGIEMEAENAKKAEEEGIAVLCTPKDAYEICGLLYQAGIPGVD